MDVRSLLTRPVGNVSSSRTVYWNATVTRGSCHQLDEPVVERAAAGDGVGDRVGGGEVLRRRADAGLGDPERVRLRAAVGGERGRGAPRPGRRRRRRRAASRRSRRRRGPAAGPAMNSGTLRDEPRGLQQPGGLAEQELLVARARRRAPAASCARAPRRRRARRSGTPGSHAARCGLMKPGWFGSFHGAPEAQRRALLVARPRARRRSACGRRAARRRAAAGRAAACRAARSRRPAPAAQSGVHVITASACQPPSRWREASARNWSRTPNHSRHGSTSRHAAGLRALLEVRRLVGRGLDRRPVDHEPEVRRAGSRPARRARRPTAPAARARRGWRRGSG